MTDAPGWTFKTLPQSERLSDLGSNPTFDAVVIGSGYGGSIAASRIAAAFKRQGTGKTVCLLERGRDLRPGDYPRDLAGARKEIQLVTARQGRLDPNANGMMELRVNDDVHVIVGNGLGGGSLVNAGVSIRPDMRVFETGWPSRYHTHPAAGHPGEVGPMGLSNILAQPTDYFERVTTKLGAAKLPEGTELPKLTALKQSATAMKQRFERADINVSFEDGPNHFGVTQAACNMCGDCCSGCNYGAKNTLLMNYIPDAMRNGARIVTQAEVDTVVPDGDGWTVTVFDRTKPRQGQTPIGISAGMVILAAGALGSTEILARSGKASQDMARIKALGTKFSANGDVLGFGFGANLPGSNGEAGEPTPLFSIGAGINAPGEAKYRPGPCITGVIRVDMGRDKPLDHGMVIEDGTAPGPFAAIYPPAMFLQEVLGGAYTEYPDAAPRMRALAQLGADLQSGADPASLSYDGVMTRMQSYLVMSHDGADGRLAFDEATGLVHVDWPGAGSAPGYLRDNARLKEAAGAIWADYIPNPIWQEGFGRNIVSVHPLGGCPMADNERDGVTDPWCRVYKGDGTNAVHETLLVCDGSVIPTSLGVNPLLTISAITEMAMDKLVGKEPADSRADRIHMSPDRTTRARASHEAGGEAIGSGVDWQLIASGIKVAKLSADVTKSLCDERPGTTVAAEISTNVGVFLTGMIRNAAGTDITAFMLDFFTQVLLVDKKVLAKAQADIGAVFTRFSDQLQRLADIADNIPSGASVQDFLDALFGIVGDISPSFGFNETMRGWVSGRRASQDDAISNPYEIAEALGRRDKTALRAEFTVDAKSTLDTDAKSVSARVLGAELGGFVYMTDAAGTERKYTATHGRFDLLQQDPDRVESWTMRYRCGLQPEHAPHATWLFEGEKHLRCRPGSDWWRDLTTLFVDLTPMGPENVPTHQGIIRLDLQDLAAQLSSVRYGFDCPTDVKALKTEVLAAGKDHTLNDKIANGTLLNRAFRLLMKTNLGSSDDLWPVSLANALATLFGGEIAQIFGMSILKSYGGLAAYMNDFPALSQMPSALPVPGQDSICGVTCEDHPLPDATAPKVRLFHFPPPDKTKPAFGPIILAPGMSTTSLGFALKCSRPSLVQRLLEKNYDVWLFDSRFSPQVQPINTGYTLDDVAEEDWPLAVNHVLANTQVRDANGLRPGSVQILGHCVGALTAQMALLGGHVETEKVRQMVLLQFTVHPAASWFNVVKSEVGLAQDFVNGFPQPLVDLVHAQLGDGKEWDAVSKLLTGPVDKVDPVSPPPGADGKRELLDEVLNAVVWKAPFGIDHVCLSPTCHRIYGLYGPVIAHRNMDEATHIAMREVFGEIATKPFEQLGLIMQRGRAVSAKGEDKYLRHPERLRLPIHIISGAINQIILPESGYYTQEWLKQSMPEHADWFTRTLIEGYAHNDCFMGRNADRDVFPDILQALSKHASPPEAAGGPPKGTAA